MNSMPARSAICARAKQSDQLPDQRSGTIVTARPDEQLAPNKPSLSRFALYIAARSACAIGRSIRFSRNAPHPVPLPAGGERECGCNAGTNPSTRSVLKGRQALPLPASGERAGVRGFLHRLEDLLLGHVGRQL